MGLGQCDIQILVERTLLEIKARAVGVGTDEAESFAQRTFALTGQETGLVAIEAVGLGCLEVIHEPGFFHFRPHVIHDQSFGLAFAEKRHIVFGQIVHCLAVFL